MLETLIILAVIAVIFKAVETNQGQLVIDKLNLL